MKTIKREWMNVYTGIEVKQDWRPELQMCRWGPNFPKHWVCTLKRTTEIFTDGTICVSLEIEEEAHEK